MVAYQCCKCGAVNHVHKVNGAADKTVWSPASGNESEEKVLLFHKPDQEEYARIYEDAGDAGKYD